MTQEQAVRNTRERSEDEVKDTSKENIGKTASSDVKVSDIDELLAEIDSVLEEDAAEFVSLYRQVGGQ